MRTLSFNAPSPREGVILIPGTDRPSLHPVVGELHLNFEAMTLASEPDLTILVYTAAPGSPTADALQLLARWAAAQKSHATGDDPRNKG